MKSTVETITPTLRKAHISDITQMHVVRNTVRENVLSNPELITHDDYQHYLTVKGEGWVVEMENQIVGFAIVDSIDSNVWALFVQPDFEGKGIGLLLHNTMLDWYFSQHTNKIWLSTERGTRAERFYITAGWQFAGSYGKNEVKFEMEYKNWIRLRQLNMNENISKEIAVLEQQLVDAIQRSDVNFIDSILHDDLLFLAPNGITVTKEMDLSSHRSGAMKVDMLTMELQEIRLLGDMAVSIVVYDTKGTMLGEPIEGRFKYIRTWRKYNTWKIMSGACVQVRAS